MRATFLCDLIPQLRCQRINYKKKQSSSVYRLLQKYCDKKDFILSGESILKLNINS